MADLLTDVFRDPFYTYFCNRWKVWYETNVSDELRINTKLKLEFPKTVLFIYSLYKTFLKNSKNRIQSSDSNLCSIF